MSNNSYYNDQWRIINEPNQNKVSNYSMSFDGTSSYINISDYIFGGLSSLSISCWYNLDSISTDQAILAKWVEDRAILLYHDAPNGWKFLLSTSSGDVTLQSTFVATINTWQHLAVTYESGVGVKIYLNGVAQSSAVQSGTAVTPSPSEFNIGRDALTGSNTRYFNGQLDQLSIFDYALSASQVSTLYGGGTSVVNPMSLSPKPIAAYQLGDQSVDNGANYLVPNNSLDGYVFNFDNHYMQTQSNTPSALNGATSLSISAWVNFSAVLGTTSYIQIIMSNWISGVDGVQYLFRFVGSSTAPELQLYLHTGTAAAVGTKSFNAVVDTWYLVTGVWDGSNIKLYTDTSAGGNTAFSGSLNSTSESDKIGSHLTNLHKFEGSILNLAVWKNTALTQTQVTEIYNNRKVIDLVNDFSGANPTVYYKLNGDDDTYTGGTGEWTINDSIGGRDAVSVGMSVNNLIQDDFVRNSVYGYSPYALNFDGVDDYLSITSTDFKGSGGTVSYSFWVKPNTYSGSSNYGYFISNSLTGGGIAYSEGGTSIGTTPGQLYLHDMTTPTPPTHRLVNLFLDENVWNHIVVVFNTGNGVQLYKNGFFSNNITNVTSFNSTWDTIAARSYSGVVNNHMNGELSNFSIFDTALTSTQVNEIYNQGVPSNLHNFSGTAPTAWWQIGSNSSFNSSTWTCLDEIGTNNAVSAGSMTNSDIVDGVGYSASGLGTSSIDIVGDAPYSLGNGISQGGMDVLDRSTDIPS